MKFIITIRHGEAYKNLKDISGGLGSGLTPRGVEQVQESAQRVAAIIAKNPQLKTTIYRSCDRVQLMETTEILTDRLGIPCQIDERFAPIKLGVFNGMSGKKQRELYPVAAQEMQEWNDGVRDIMDVHVEGMQNPGEHVNKIIDFLNDQEDNSVTIMVGTRSDLSAVKNITRGNHPWKKDTYRFIPTDFAEVDMFAYDEMGFKSVMNFNPQRENESDTI